MTMLFRTNNLSHNDGISSVFSNLKEKLEEYDNKNLDNNNSIS